MANTTTTTLNDLLPQIVAEAMFQANEKSIMRGLVKNFTMPLNSGKSIVVPTYPKVTAAAIAEGTDLSTVAQAVSTDGATLTVSEVGAMTTVTDLALRTSSSNVIADVGRLFGEAIASRIDKDLTALFGSFSTGVGAADQTITVNKIFEAVANLRKNGVPATDLACVLHPMVAYDLKAAIGTQAFAGGDLQTEALRSGYVGTLAGVPIFESSNMTDASDNDPGTTGDYKGGLFHRDALGLAMMQDIQIEQQRDASLRATELVATAVYGKGEIFDSYGIEMEFDSTIQ
jgi:N4-gp56 family major capsid protein